VLLFLPAHVAALTPITNSNIGTAVSAWVTNPTTAATTYGNIVGWNTAAVSNMNSLFAPPKQAINADISKWNVASVTDMLMVGLDSYAWVCTYLRRTVRALSVGVNRVRFGSQVLSQASAFNANIGAWNTARVKTLENVCAAFASGT
jgi:hypothetical protein